MDASPPLLVVDSSVVVKWFVHENENHVPAALDVLEKHLDGSHVLAAPDHLRLEVLNALRCRRLSDVHLIEAAERLELANLAWFSVDGPLTRAAIALSGRHKLTIYDAVFAALAVSLGCELVTDDRQLAASGACDVRTLD
ncbi:MAG: type II toxin-antitoxin system VapC family toxin [Actinomycetota bacterium]|nr:MAG: hypothetical protein FD171_641 [Actinomycetota bacterium]MDO8949141.1 type II toxin-antitoxin system VapC family toxin [Actinomycetota bacterium]MDP3629359.1 type II toxin-antitoxin system VapC family toxin [Actinomycetota bacterium]